LHAGNTDNALFAALSTQIQSLQQGTQNQAKNQGNVDGDKPPRGPKTETTNNQNPPTVLSSTGQVERSGPVPNVNLREVPTAATGAGQSFTAPRSQSFSWQVPDGDTSKRQVCDDCGWIHYDNPKIVVGAVCTWGDKFLLCRRAIEPRSGYWTIPAGYLEENESTEQGAAREAYEEAEAKIEIDTLLGIYNIPRISQVQLIYRATLVSDKIGPGLESLEVGFFDWDTIPWDNLAFPTVVWSLNHFKEVEGRDGFAPFTNPPGGDTMPPFGRGAKS
jgi:ADP-ribose pyrophosphatase YjhB (NUDIX family)